MSEIQERGSLANTSSDEVRVIRVDFVMSAACPGVISDMLVVGFCRLKASVST
jgi:hypothetical protein